MAGKDDDQTYLIPNRGQIEIRLSKKRRPADAGGTVRSGPAGRGGVMGGFVPDDENVIRKAKPRITFHDLGTRLRSVPAPSSDTATRSPDATVAPDKNDDWYNEYLEVGWADAGTPFYDAADRAYTYLDLTLAQIQGFESAMLGRAGDHLNPFETYPANISGRELPACAPIPHSNDLQLDARLGRTKYPLNPDRVLTAHEDYYLRPDSSEPDPVPVSDDVADAWKIEEDATAGERWNPLNVTDDGEGLRVHAYGYLEPLAGFDGESLQVISGSRYGSYEGSLEDQRDPRQGYARFEPFDTGDPRYKVTRLPSAAADVAQFKLREDADIRVYLVPVVARHFADWSIYYHTAGGGSGDDFYGHHWAAETQAVRLWQNSRLIAGIRYPAVHPLYWAARVPRIGEQRRNIGMHLDVAGPIRGLAQAGNDATAPNYFPASQGWTRISPPYDQAGLFVEDSWLRFPRTGRLVGAIWMEGATYYVWRTFDDLAGTRGVGILYTNWTMPEWNVVQDATP